MLVTVLLMQPIAGHRFSFAGGQYVELEEWEAKRLIDKGYAVEVEEPDLRGDGIEAEEPLSEPAEDPEQEPEPTPAPETPATPEPAPTQKKAKKK